MILAPLAWWPPTNLVVAIVEPSGLIGTDRLGAVLASDHVSRNLISLRAELAMTRTSKITLPAAQLARFLCCVSGGHLRRRDGCNLSEIRAQPLVAPPDCRSPKADWLTGWQPM